MGSHLVRYLDGGGVSSLVRVIGRSGRRDKLVNARSSGYRTTHLGNRTQVSDLFCACCICSSGKCSICYKQGIGGVRNKLQTS